jgi:YVTN family beta-propeller protein
LLTTVVSVVVVGAAVLFAVMRPGSARARSHVPEAAGSTTTTALNVYAKTGVGMLRPSVMSIPARVYVPDSESDMVEVIDPTTLTVIDRFAVPRRPQHVVPSHDMTTLYVNSDLGNALTPIDPRTGKPGPPIAVDDPYNLYFTPDGTKALVVP